MDSNNETFLLAACVHQQFDRCQNHDIHTCKDISGIHYMSFWKISPPIRIVRIGYQAMNFCANILSAWRACMK
jgi:hypothetical protein